ncbi:hypothetical protein QTJ16_001573 [Diplocarpon rosae]|uniref:Uncharacterized protein n=1 Tax=Diplocarpon rosae TaxID=946125 RepID=A0AAD9WEK3_9HELO|nr:hypothetical protein QTJ16_001573 [Diplocarpon rosae]PBP16761.1 hypothetical protein BUE80_DR012585 [Diplocarpon rosae]
MFSSLSRGSSKVKQSNICSSCLCNIITNQISQTGRLPADRATHASSASFSISATRPQIDDGEPKSTSSGDADAVQKEEGNGSSVEREGFREKGPGYNLLPPRPISSSKTTLKALRQSLIAANDPVPKKAGLNSYGDRKPKKKKKSGEESPKAEQEKERPQMEAKEKAGSNEEIGDSAHKLKATQKKKKKKGTKPRTTVPDSSAEASSPIPKKQSKEKEDAGSVLHVQAQNGNSEAVKAGEASAMSRKKGAATSKRLPGASTKPLRILRVNSEIKRVHMIRRANSDIPTGNDEVMDLEDKEWLANNPTIGEKLDELGRGFTMRQGVVKLYSSLTAVEQAAARKLLPSKHTKPKVAPGHRSGADLGPVQSMKGSVAEEVKTISADNLHLASLNTEPLEVAQLSYGLDRVLFNPGVYQLQDPRSRVFNFDPYLQKIMPVNEFDFDALKEYVTSSRDMTLLSKAIAEKKKYTGSTSSMTSALSHFHFLLSQWRRINVGYLSKMFPVEYTTFTSFQRAPVAIFLRWRDGAYAIDADKEFDTANILSMLGKSMEKLLTLSTEDFEKYRKSGRSEITDEELKESEQYHYTGMGDFLMRSQLDAHDSRLPGTGMFDLKTRSVVSVRMDAKSFEEGRGYEIRGRHGEWESFEKEYYDMIRSAFLKYSLQVRMGRMDGIFVAYHNTMRIFGFQYISLPELDYALHGTEDTTLGDSEFKLSLELLNRVLDRATAKYPEQSLRLHFETRDTATPFTYIFAEPISEPEIETIQATNKAKIEEFEKEVLGIFTKDLTPEEQQEQWDKIRASVEESMEKDAVLVTLDEEEEQNESEDILATNSLEEDFHEEDGDEVGDVGMESVETLEVVEIASTHSEVSKLENSEEDVDTFDADEVAESDDQETEPVEYNRTSADEVAAEEHFEDASESKAADAADPSDSINGRSATMPEVLAMTLVIRNKVNGNYVERPCNLSEKDRWEVEYSLSEIPGVKRVASLYGATRTRRFRATTKTVDLKADSRNNIYIQNIKKYNAKGRAWREAQDKIDQGLVTTMVDSINVKLSSPQSKE